MPTQADPHPIATRRVLTAILVLYVLLASWYSVRVPIFEASDELWHYPMVEVIARTWQLPVQPLEPGTVSGPWRQEGSQPPLYYALGAVLTTWIDTSDMDVVRRPNPHARAGEITPERDNVNLVIHDPAAEAFPWSGTVLAVHIVRFFSVALGTWAVYLTWALVRELFPTRPWLATGAAAVHAFTPMALFISSSINNDNLIIPLSSLALLWMVRRVRRRPDHAITERAHLLSSVALGVVIGLALLTKASGIALLAFAAATLAWEAWRFPQPASWIDGASFLVKHTAAILVPAAALAGWWFVRNVRLYGDGLGFNAFYAVLGTRDVPANVAQLWAERMAFASGYWGNFGGLNVPMPTWVYTVLNGLAVMAALGLLISFAGWLRRRDDGDMVEKLWPFAWSSTTAARALAWAFPVGVFVSWTRWATFTWSSQGRLIFTALSMWSLALVFGLSAWVPRRGERYRWVPGAALGSLLFALSLIALPAWITPAYEPPNAVDVPPTRLGMTPLEARFGDELSLLGYAVSDAGVHPGDALEVQLMWQAAGPAPTHRSVFIHLLGEGERIVAQRDSFPGHGLLPATRIQPGRTWVERHLLPVPITAFTPDILTLAVGVYETHTGARVPVTDPARAEDPEMVRFGDIPLMRQAADDGEEAFRVAFGNGIALTGYELSGVVTAPGEPFSVTLHWLCTGPVDGDYTISVQLIDTHWRKAAQLDSWPLEGQAPTSSWQKGQRITETRTMVIAPDAEPSAYDLQISIYRPGDDGELEHLPISLGDAGMPTKSIVLTRVRVR